MFFALGLLVFISGFGVREGNARWAFDGRAILLIDVIESKSAFVDLSLNDRQLSDGIGAI